MAYTSIIPVRCLDRAVDYVRDKTKTTRGPKSLQDAVDYAINREKTELDCFETGLSCVCETAFEDMRDTVQRWQQTAGVQGYHLVQSFAEGEVTPELAHQIGVELAEQLLQGRFQTVVTTHLNTKHYHNHIVWCSVAFDNGRKYHTGSDLAAISAVVKSERIHLPFQSKISYAEAARKTSSDSVQNLGKAVHPGGYPTAYPLLTENLPRRTTRPSCPAARDLSESAQAQRLARFLLSGTVYAGGLSP